MIRLLTIVPLLLLGWVLPAQAAPPNILFAIADDWGWGHAGAYGADWVNTPGFDRVAREGLLFTHHYTPNAKCAPSRAATLTGRNSWQLEEACNHFCAFPPKFTSYPEALSTNGYFVGTTGKGWGPGYAHNEAGKPREIAGQVFAARKTNPPTRAMGNNDYAANFQDFLDAAPEDKPWCFWYGATEPHRAYEYGSGVAKGGKQLADVDHVPAYWPDNDTVRNDMLDYALEVEYVDQHLVRILTLIEERGQLDNTLVVVTSDHGMPFPRAKGQAYDFSNRIPLAIMWPAGINSPGRTIDDYTSMIDIAPTFLDVAGVSESAGNMQPITGRSLTNLFKSSQSGKVDPARDHVLIGKERHDVGRPNDWGYPVRGIVKDELLYIHNYEPTRWPAGNPETGYLNTDGGATKTFILAQHREDPDDPFWAFCFGKRAAEELYDLRKDPDCVANLAESADYQQKLAALRTQMETELKAEGDPRMFGRGEIFEKMPYTDQNTARFYERFMRGEPIRAGWVSPSDFEPAPLD